MTPAERREREEYLALLEEKHRRVEARRVVEDRDAILAKCATLHGFIEEFWYVLEPVAEFRSGWVIRAMCDHLEAVHYGHIQDLLITVPPGLMKSLLVSVFFQAWEWGPKGRPDLRYLATSFSDDNVTRDSDKVRKLIESEKYQALWGAQVKPGSRWGVYNFSNTKGGVRDCRPFGSLTGGRGDRVLIDDPHSVKTAESDVQREETVRLYREGATDRLNDITRSATIVIMQRVHQKDVAGEIIDLGGFVHLNLPMEFEPKRKCVTVLRPANDGNPALLFEDPRTVEGELLFPERFPADAVAKLKKRKGPYAWAGQYQQRPAPREGGIFSRDDFKRVSSLPPGCRRECRAWDLGATQGGGDPTAGVKCTVDDDAPEEIRGFYFTHAARAQLAAPGVEKLIRDTAKDDGTGCIVRLPQDPGAAGKSYASILVGKLAGWAAKAVAPTGSKVTRAMALSSAAGLGNVYILETGDPVQDEWIEPFLEEIEMFPAGAHDDQVDAAADAFNELALPEMKGQSIYELARRQAEAQAAAAAEAEKPAEVTYAPGSMEYMMAMQGEAPAAA